MVPPPALTSRDVDHRDAERPAVDVVLVGGLHEPVARRWRTWRWSRPCRTRSAGRQPSARGQRSRSRSAPAAGPDSIVCTGLDAAASSEKRAAVGLGDEQPAAEAAAGEALLEGAEVAVDDRQDVGVDHGGAGALVLAPLLGDPVRDRDRRRRAAPRPRSRPRAARAPGCGTRRGTTMATDSHAVGGQPPGGRAHRGLVERDQHLAPRGQPLAAPPGGARAARAGSGAGRGRRTSRRKLPRPISSTSRKPSVVIEAGPRALALQQRVDRRWWCRGSRSRQSARRAPAWSTQRRTPSSSRGAC